MIQNPKEKKLKNKEREKGLEPKIHDKESAKDCFISWFLHGNEIMEDLENLIPIQQQKFYDENFMSISEKEFPNGFKELEFQIDNVEVL